MRDFRDAKLMAKALRDALKPTVDLGHGECLEITARMFGLKDWNTLSAAITKAVTTRPIVAIPDGWVISGSKPEFYSVGLDTRLRHASGTPATIQFLPEANGAGPNGRDRGFATLMQSVSAEVYRGKRIRLDAELRTEAVDGAATIWLRIDRSPGQMLAFDNMEQRDTSGPLSGTQDWSPRRIVLDVPSEASSIHFGFYLRGAGQAWAAGFGLEDAGSAPATAVGSGLRAHPTNLDFTRLRSPGT